MDKDFYINNKKRIGLKFYLFFKRILDLLFSLFTIILLSPIWLIILIIVFFDTKACPLYLQKRVGKNGKEFNICKFRTMVKDSDNIKKYLTKNQIKEWHNEHKVDNDPRITRFGEFLRKTSIDELPNFINVLTGSMSIIGPRCITQEELEYYGENKDLFLSVKPGITGWWQVESRNEAVYKNGSRQKLELFYCNNISFLLDCKIFFRTFLVVFSCSGR